ncbi:restriction endonuclease subunit S [Macrococcoides caseolyticum]|uniref:restriction endonuclease subunit S n=1 Tax=Macrococcoides caseolyticum TaxID=69966 RepID=UPI002A23B6C2|nr:restriction endonuclease subunit S [Macrococcus caseolyticus]
MSNVPDIRFKGFTDAWEQRKLGDVVKITMGQSPNSINYTNNPDDYILVQGNADMKNGFVHPRVWTTQITKTAEVGDIILSVRAPVGDVAKTDYDIVLGRGVAGIKGNQFIFQLLKKYKEDGYWKKISTGSTFESINSNIIKEAKLLLPSAKEQNYLGDFFYEMDQTITLLQRELDSLKIIKGSLLHKLFPGINEQNPCIRLSNFKENWKSVKLADISNRVTRKNKDLESKIPLTISALYGLVDQTQYFSKQIASERLENYILIKKGEFAYNKSYSNGYPFGAVKRLDNYDKGVLSSLYIVFELLSIVDSNFMKYYFETKLWHKEVQKKSAEGARNHGLLNITATDFLSLKIKMPNDINEQVKIGEYFKSLDLKIDKLNQEIILYQKMKKAFLQKLFPKGD